MLAREEVMIDRDMACGAARNPIDEVIAGRLSCREFSGSPVSRSTIEQILRVARFAPSGANIQPWHIYVLAGAAKTEVSAALLHAYENEPSEHVSEYQYYATAFPEPYLGRRQEFGDCSTPRSGSLKAMLRRGAGRPRRTIRSSARRLD
ncbi:nitroreductase family protein [Bradyrhizobium elkanii]|uniref:nitroreductase family protein n=1 Tax=Bradyrhizobium elkanii TaxID=29448 RepID=UPI00144937AD|nr:nitroreductase family protein [Bradyrhizobium elkanii]MCS3580858.1 nitroreductase [Bradyrhizobium elkanii]MCS3723734.1 nitroreductase [Bradyrhizobium elkanii]MCS4008144.1 nitroreductase [Bradyrhizobium elkanii USDA 61]BBC03229.1 hypothetical protein BE61_86950 [Bradyrhizobium elkanii USDA 61]